MAKVTVGMVVKDSEGTVAEAIKSIASQTYPHNLLQMVVVDGASKDQTLSIIRKEIRKLADIPVRLHSDKGSGLGAARQMVVDSALSDYILWIDSDATIAENYVASLVEFIENHPRHGGARGIQEVSKQRGLVARLENLPRVLRRTPRTVFDTNGQLFRLEAVRMVGGFDRHIRGAGEDVDLILRMISVGWKFSQIQSKFYHKIGSWNEIYQKRVRAGNGMHYVCHKQRIIGPMLNQIFFISFIVGVREAIAAYRLTRQKISFLLPLWYCLKGIPWWIGWIGFDESQIHGYGHS